MIEIGGKLFACDECPVCESWERRLEDAIREGYDFQYDHCGCEKVDGQFFAGGYCEDAFVHQDLPPEAHRSGKRRTGAAYRRKATAKKKQRLYGILTTKFVPCSGYVESEYIGTTRVPVGTYVKPCSGSERKRFLKRSSNRAVRRSAVLGSGKGGYRRCFDYQWGLI